MRLKQLNVDKELKKVQGQGIYNKKVRTLLVIGVVCLVVVIGSSFAAFSSDRILSAFTSSVSKKVKVTLSVENGSINGSNIKEGTYNENITYQVTPNSGYTYESSTCPNSSYNKETNTLIINTTNNVSCSIKFKQSLSETILASNTLKTETPNFLIGEPPTSGSNTGSGLYKTEDDDGESYYFRGAIENNYVSFANMIWRIVRVNGDGTIRLIKEESIGRSMFNEKTSEDKYLGYSYDNNYKCTINQPCLNTTGTSSTVKEYVEIWYDNNLIDYEKGIALTNYCSDTTNVKGEYANDLIYSAQARTTEMGEPSLKCADTNVNYGGIYKLKIGLLSVDEYNYAGIGANPTADQNYLHSSWSMSPLRSGVGGSIDMGHIYGDTIDSEFSIYPVINLKSDVTLLNGNGTQNNPYVVEAN